MEPLNPYAAPQDAALVHSDGRQPDSLPEIIAFALALYASHAPAIIGVTLAVWAPLELLEEYYAQLMVAADDYQRAVWVSLFIENVFGVIASGGVIAIGQAAMNGEPTSLWSGLRVGFESWSRLVGTRIVVGFIVIVGLVAFVIPGIYVAVRSIQAEVVAVVERRNPMESMQRSFELTQGEFFRYAALAAIAIAGVLAVSILWGVATTYVPQLDHWLVAATVSLVVDLISAWLSLVFVVAYRASRRRKGEET